MRIGEIVNRSDILVGEVAGVEGDILEVFVYPERYNDIFVGSLVLIDSSDLKILGIVVRKTHSSRYGTFAPLRKNREELHKAYPDLDRYHRYVSSILYTSVLVDETPVHVRRGSPRLHDMVYVLKKSDLIMEFLKPRGGWDFSFINHLIGARLSPHLIMETIGNLLSQVTLNEDEKESMLSSLLDVVWAVSRDFAIELAKYLEDVLNLW